MCRGCTSCSNGLNGQNGLPGCDGQDGAKGEKGVTGSRGLKGDAGPKGSNADHRNWKQCAWKGANRRDIGLVKVSINIVQICKQSFISLFSGAHGPV